jgi:hypothetical protein
MNYQSKPRPVTAFQFRNETWDDAVFRELFPKLSALYHDCSWIPNTEERMPYLTISQGYGILLGEGDWLVSTEDAYRSYTDKEFRERFEPLTDVVE